MNKLWHDNEMKKERYSPGHIWVVLVLLLMNICSVAAAEQLRQSGKVMRVSDGDTTVIQPAAGGEFIKCRLAAIDAPEIQHGRQPGQSYGEEAARELKNMILGQHVDIEIKDIDQYGRKVCRIIKGGVDINLQMIKQGYAWAYTQFLHGPYASEYIGAEKEARSKRLGLWQDNNPQAPWEFRRIQRRR